MVPSKFSAFPHNFPHTAEAVAHNFDVFGGKVRLLWPSTCWMNYFRWLFPSETWMSLPIAFSLIESQGGKSKPTAALVGHPWG
jgi:hypothetical protein